jgi:lysyl-tRNA synthetase class 2
LKESKDPYPYPHKFEVKLTIPQFLEKYGALAPEQVGEEVVTVAGRVSNMRAQSKKLKFYDLRGGGEKLQVLASLNYHKGPREFGATHRLLRRGDIVGIVGQPGRTKTGELSVYAHDVQLLSPCLRMLPEFHVGIKEDELRYRKRYLDLIFNAKSRETFALRSKVIRHVRSYFEERGFMEVETPMMNMIPGGATARPFVTHHNDLKMDLYLRIAPELYLKELVVGGFDRVFEIGKNFRNEGIDPTHNPEYTACEAYMAYADFNDWMAMTEEMLSSMALAVKGSYKFSIHPNPKDPSEAREIDFTPPWRRLPMMEGLAQELGVALPQDLDSEEARLFFDGQCAKHGVACDAPRSTTRLIDKLVGRFLESQCLNPTFITEHPQQMSPLSKYHRSKPGLSERFELFINYHEFCNSYTELNDPFKQKELFLDQVNQKKGGDSEAMHYDHVFVDALEHALPPTGGWGLGIDRTVMLLSDNFNIKEVILFPAMKPEDAP